jgi:prepilin-type N-terminal cleavage/methylation domain-containing protein
MSIHTISKKGFTLVELLIVIAIVAILVAIIFVALDPATRFAQARDAVRQNDVGEILSAIKLYQVDNGGDHLASIGALTPGDVYMAVNGAVMTTGCGDSNVSCETDVTDDTSCVNIAGLVSGGYLAAMPVSPAGDVVWDGGTGATDKGSGYTISVDINGIVTVRACESEYANNPEIQISR